MTKREVWEIGEGKVEEIRKEKVGKPVDKKQSKGGEMRKNYGRGSEGK